MHTKEINRAQQVWDSLKVDLFTTRLFVDPVAVPLVALFSNFKFLTPNRVTLLALIAGLVSAFFFSTGSFTAGAFSYYIFFLFDCIDGKLARLTKNFSPLGAFYDFTVDRIVVSAMGFGLCVAFLENGRKTDCLLAFGFILVFLLKDAVSLKWPANLVASKGPSSPDVSSRKRGLSSRLKIHFNPGQIMSCFVVFFAAPLLGVFTEGLIFGIACVLISIAKNIILPFSQYQRQS